MAAIVSNGGPWPQPGAELRMSTDLTLSVALSGPLALAAAACLNRDSTGRAGNRTNTLIWPQQDQG